SMQIDNLSEQLDIKPARLEQQIANHRSARRQLDDPEAQDVIDSDIATLQETRAKLLKSRSLAWQVHELRKRQEMDASGRDTRYRQLGVALMIASAIAMAAIIATYVWLS